MHMRMQQARKFHINSRKNIFKKRLFLAWVHVLNLKLRKSHLVVDFHLCVQSNQTPRTVQSLTGPDSYWPAVWNTKLREETTQMQKHTA